jgi:hypothetical protein
MSIYFTPTLAFFSLLSMHTGRVCESACNNDPPLAVIGIQS